MNVSEQLTTYCLPRSCGSAPQRELDFWDVLSFLSGDDGCHVTASVFAWVATGTVPGSPTWPLGIRIFRTWQDVAARGLLTVTIDGPESTNAGGPEPLYHFGPARALAHEYVEIPRAYIERGWLQVLANATQKWLLHEFFAGNAPAGDSRLFNDWFAGILADRGLRQASAHATAAVRALVGHGLLRSELVDHLRFVPEALLERQLCRRPAPRLLLEDWRLSKPNARRAEQAVLATLIVGDSEADVAALAEDAYRVLSSIRPEQVPFFLQALATRTGLSRLRLKRTPHCGPACPPRVRSSSIRWRLGRECCGTLAFDRPVGAATVAQANLVVHVDQPEELPVPPVNPALPIELRNDAGEIVWQGVVPYGRTKDRTVHRVPLHPAIVRTSWRDRLQLFGGIGRNIGGGRVRVYVEVILRP